MPCSPCRSLRPSLHSARWWVGRSPLSGGWRAVAPADLPAEAAAYLGPSVIVLNNIPTSELSASQQQRLEQYVHDLGGALVVLGGDHAFAAGGYPGSVLDALSPLASSPPLPVMHWVLLADSSGSMAEQVGGQTRWQLAAEAMLRLLPQLPPQDAVSVGNFAESLTWWSRGKSAKETAAVPLPPADVAPRGPTNLQPALKRIIAESAEQLPRQVLILTDTQTQIDRPEDLAAAMKAKSIRLHVLALGQGSGLPVLRSLVAATGGLLVEQMDARQWTESVRQLLRQAMPQRLNRLPVDVRFTAPLSLPGRPVTPWNRVWLKQSATGLAEAQTPEGPVVLGARWQVGTGQAIAAAFSANDTEAIALTDLVARPPRDPRFSVSWDAGAQLRVSVDAVDPATKAYLNGLDVRLELADAAGGPSAGGSHIMTQTAPGRYEIVVPAPRASVFAAVRQQGQVMDRRAIAGRYASEFDGMGNDHGAMRELAARTDGAVIYPDESRPIDFHWPSRPLPLTSALAAAAAAFIAAGLVRWRMG